MVTGQLQASAALFPGNKHPAFTENEGDCAPQSIRTLQKTRIFSFSFLELNLDSLAVQSANVTILTELSYPATKMKLAPTFHVDTRNQMQVNNNLKIKYAERYGQTRFSRYPFVVCTDTKHNKI
jgi:hypothetical protein